MFKTLKDEIDFILVYIRCCFIQIKHKINKWKTGVRVRKVLKKVSKKRDKYNLDE